MSHEVAVEGSPALKGWVTKGRPLGQRVDSGYRQTAAWATDRQTAGVYRFICLTFINPRLSSAVTL